jgi:hypothetical protein
MDSSAAAPAEGVVLFFRAQARLKEMRRVPRQALATAKCGDLSDNKSLHESGMDGSTPATTQSNETEKVSVSQECRRDSVLAGKAHQDDSAVASTTRIGRPDLQRSESLPNCLRIRPSANRIAAEHAAIDHESDLKSIVTMRQRMNAGFDCLANTQKQLDKHVALLGQVLAGHGDYEQAQWVALSAREVAAAKERVVLAELGVAHQRRKAEAARLESSIVAEVVPQSAPGRAHCKPSDVRKFAGTKIKYQMVADSSYPRLNSQS